MSDAPLLKGAPRFTRLTLAECRARINAFDWTRRVVALHMHNTQSPARHDWAGERTIQGMWDYHTRVNGWSDIAQHVTIAPDGGCWLGRDWNRPPASNSGDNGSSKEGPFMFEIVGDFDKGHETLDGAQRISVLGVSDAVQDRFLLAPATLLFHRMLGTPKTCPGSGIAYDPFVAELAAYRASIGCP